MSTDFSQGKIWRRIVAQAVPLTLAQLVQLLYNIVDRIYIGHMPGAGSAALTGVGLTFPIVTLIAAFTALFSMGGTPLFSIARGAGEEEKARRIMGNVFSLLCGTSLLLMALCLVFRRPIMFLFGASETSYIYADAYLKIYLLGTPFAMLSSASTAIQGLFFTCASAFTVLTPMRTPVKLPGPVTQANTSVLSTVSPVCRYASSTMGSMDWEWVKLFWHMAS